MASTSAHTGTNGIAAAVADELDAATAQAVVENTHSQSISADEIALYDRQIRLWGVQAQEKLRTANVLLIGMRALANEIAKNLVLAGIGSLTIVEDGIVTEDDLGAQFFISDEHLGQNRALAALPQIQKLNPRVVLHVLTNPIHFLANDPTFFAPFTITIATDLPFPVLTTINAACRISTCPFYCASTFGLYGYAFADLITHTFVITRSKSNLPTKLGPETPTRSILSATTKRDPSTHQLTELVTKSETYTPLLLANSSPLPAYHTKSLRRKLSVHPLLSCLRALWSYQSLPPTDPSLLPHTPIFPSPNSHSSLLLFTKLATTTHADLLLPHDTLRADFLRTFLQNLGCELSPTCAFLGGMVAQDVINVIGGKEQPLQNLLLFDGEDSKGPVYSMQPFVPDLGLEGNLAGLNGGGDGRESNGVAAAVIVNGTGSAAAPTLL